MLLKNCRLVVTQNDQRDILENTDLLVDGNTIQKIGSNLEGEPVIDCSNKIVIPGLINAHCHLGMHLLRGISDDKELAPWLHEIVQAEQKLTNDQVLEGCRLGIKEAIRTGTTTIVDMYDNIGPSIQAAEELGMRLLAVKAFFTAHQDMPAEITFSNSVQETTTKAIGPHSIYGTDEDFLKKARDFASKNNTLLHMHLSETRKERAECKLERGTLPVQYLDSIDFLDEDVMLVHCNWLTKGELDILAKHNTRIVHCPQSNMKLAGGMCMPVREMLERNITIALGTDSVVSNNSMDMFREMHTAALLHKHHYWSGEATTAQQILDMATRNGARVMNRTDIGSLEEGKLADIILIDIPTTLPTSRENVVSHLVYAINGLHVSDAIINGEVRMQDRVLR